MLPREGEGSLSSSRLLRPAPHLGTLSALRRTEGQHGPQVLQFTHLPLMTGWLESEGYCVLIFLSLTVFRARRTKLWKGPPSGDSPSRVLSPCEGQSRPHPKPAMEEPEPEDLATPLLIALLLQPLPGKGREDLLQRHPASMLTTQALSWGFEALDFSARPSSWHCHSHY